MRRFGFGCGDEGAGGRHVRLLHHLLGECLGPLKLCRSRGGSEDREARLAQGVGNTGDQRCLRANNHQVCGELAGERNSLLGVIGVDGVYRNVLSDARVAGCAVNFGYLWIARKRTDNCVFAAAGAQYQNLHVHKGTVSDAVRAGASALFRIVGCLSLRP